MVRSVVLICCLSFISLFAQEFATKYNYETNYLKALKKAKILKKDILFVIISDYCPWCDRLKEEVLSLEYTDEIVQKHYMPLILNNSYDKFPIKFNTPYVPSVHFVNYKDETIIETVIGFNYHYRFYEVIEANEQ